jgi:hypothetical protein
MKPKKPREIGYEIDGFGGPKGFEYFIEKSAFDKLIAVMRIYANPEEYVSHGRVGCDQELLAENVLKELCLLEDK